VIEQGYKNMSQRPVAFSTNSRSVKSVSKVGGIYSQNEVRYRLVPAFGHQWFRHPVGKHVNQPGKTLPRAGDKQRGKIQGMVVGGAF